MAAVELLAFSVSSAVGWLRPLCWLSACSNCDAAPVCKLHVLAAAARSESWLPCARTPNENTDSCDSGAAAALSIRPAAPVGSGHAGTLGIAAAALGDWSALAPWLTSLCSTWELTHIRLSLGVDRGSLLSRMPRSGVPGASDITSQSGWPLLSASTAVPETPANGKCVYCVRYLSKASRDQGAKLPQPGRLHTLPVRDRVI